MSGESVRGISVKTSLHRFRMWMGTPASADKSPLLSTTVSDLRPLQGGLTQQIHSVVFHDGGISRNVAGFTRQCTVGVQFVSRLSAL